MSQIALPLSRGAGSGPATIVLGGGNAQVAEALLHPELYPVTPGGLVVGISRSGTTTETLRATKPID